MLDDFTTMRETEAGSYEADVLGDGTVRQVVLKGCRLLNVCSGRVEETDISIAGDRIASIARRDSYDGVEIIDGAPDCNSAAP